jgi:hypothetical protein
MLVGWWCWWIACAQPGCEGQPAGPERDRCLHTRILAAAGPEDGTAAGVVRLAGLIQDPLIRDASVLAWVRDHRGAVTREDGARLCGLLGQLEKSTCEHRLSAAHLSR